MNNSIKNIIFPIEFNHFTGGMLHSVLPVIRALSNEYKVFILAHKDAAILNWNPDIPGLILKNPWSISISHPIATFRTYFEVRKLIKDYNANDTLIFTNNVGSELIFGGFGICPITFNRVFVSRGGDYLGKTGYFIKRCFNTVSSFIAISKRQFNILEGLKVNKEKIKYIPDGVFIEGWENFNYIFKNNDKINISILGYLVPEKNQELAILALPELIKENPEIKLLLYGDDTMNGKYREKLQKLAIELKVENSVCLMGFEIDKYKIFSETDILVSTSLSEGYGRTIPEAMSFGIPCVGLMESGGLLDIISTGYDGILVHNDKTELKNAITLLIKDENLRNFISINARKTYVNKFSEEIMIKRYVEYVDKYTICN